MSLKRVATDNMNHDNWDKEDPSDKEKAGVFKTASKETLEKRVLRQAKRRFPSSSSSNEKKGVFSTFAGFDKPLPKSFDFLANMTNGTNTNGSGTKSDTAVTSSLFSNKPTTTPSSGFFGAPLTGKPFSTTTQNTSLFSSNTEIPSMTFSSSKADSTVGDSPFKSQSVSSSADTNPKLSTAAQVSSTIFGVSSTSPVQNKLTNTAFKQPESSISDAGNCTAVPIQSINKDEAPMEVETDIEKARNKYYSRLKGLNVSVSSWIVKHVEKTPLCFLTPIFKDYENYLKEIQEEYEAAKVEIETKQDKQKPVFDITNRGASSFNKSQDATSTQLFGVNATSAGNTNKSTGLFEQSSTASLTESASKTTASKGFTFETSSVTNTNSDNTGGSPRQGFRMTATPSATEATSDKPVSPVGQGFSFGIKATPSATAASLDKPVSPPSQGFSFAMKSTPSAKSATSDKAVSPPSHGFQFGIKAMPSVTAASLDKPVSPPSKGFFGMTSTPFTTNSVFGKTNPDNSVSPPSKGFSFGVATTSAATPPKNTSPFTSASGANTSSPVTGFSFEMTSTPAATSPTNSATNSILGASTTSFSFGSGVPFSFSTQTRQSTETRQNTETKNEEEEDQPPKVEYTPVVEENSEFDKRCKIFVKKDDSFVDKGVGTLYIKKILESGKYQLLVRANTNLGTVLVNLVLTSAIPTQRMGKNNVMLCTPPPDTNTPPTPVLIRVKTGEEADELLETLNKYKS